jgi:hypothetical protein
MDMHREWKFSCPLDVIIQLQAPVILSLRKNPVPTEPEAGRALCSSPGSSD